MSLLLSMLPIYLFGNLHCMGMCGPLVMMIGHHHTRYYYFLGRMMSFTLAGMLAGEAGSVLNLILQQYHISAMASFFFGTLIISIGICSLGGWNYPGYHWLAKRMAHVNRTLSLLMLRDQPWPSFLFGFFTIALPCGQTIIVFSACALAGDLWVGMINGFAFALLTTPSLFLAMQAHTLFHRLKKYYQVIMGSAALLVGILAICRGLAEMEIIPHLVLNPDFAAQYHVVIY